MFWLIFVMCLKPDNKSLTVEHALFKRQEACLQEVNRISDVKRQQGVKCPKIVCEQTEVQ